jgi:solute carrier family 25 (mitochondrial citrate transporter), member 1
LLRETISSSGVRGLYSGCSALVLSNAAKGGIRFLSFTKAQAFLRTTRFGSSNPSLTNVLAGLIAGGTESLLVVTPGEALKTKMIQMRSSLATPGLGAAPQPRTLAQVAVHVVRVEGIPALWSGLVPILCKQGTNSAVRFATFGWLKDTCNAIWPHAGVGGTLMAGAASGVVTT